MTYWLGLGSNLGHRATLMAEAVWRLVREGGVRLARLSSVYETAPMGITEQPPFLNMVIAVQAEAEPRQVLEACLAAELAMGRVRREKWGPRTIDLDVLMAENREVSEEGLALPHPLMLERQFVLVPLAEIAPALRLADGRRADEAADHTHPGVVRVGHLAECVRREAQPKG